MRKFAYWAIALACSMAPIAARAADPPPAPSADQTKLDELARRATLLEAENKVLKAESERAKLRFPLQEGEIGKQGALTVESAERDKFHVTARSAGAFEAVAKKLAAKVATVASAPGLAATPRSGVVVLTDDDRKAVRVYRAESFALSTIEAARMKLLGGAGPQGAGGPQPESIGAGVATIGSALLQLAQFSQIFRTDMSIAYTASLLPDSLISDLLAIELSKARGTPSRYPSGELDALLTDEVGSKYLGRLRDAMNARAALDQKGVEGQKVSADIAALAARLGGADAATEQPRLLTILAGENAAEALDKAALSVTVSVASKGGTSMKTSSIWRSDRLYAAGGLIVTYRIATAGGTSRLIDAGAVSEETGFVRVNVN